ncbi:MAG: metal-dependent transcriptional regulator [Anaerolineae bacterium]|nr:metal-dependent transcriptional regulator [Anaerolineae bacterium]NUQ03132.1 metal-dependent transcriptional regulator [Anaerolineae bacterium]
MSDHPLQSKSVENFLKAVYALQEGDDRVATNTLSDVLNKTAPSVTDMAQRLESAGLVDYQKYRGVVLTEAGREIALKVIRRHRLIELYLVRELGYQLHEVHGEAEDLEHAVSDRFVEAIAKKLGDPVIDPHGDPIPSADGTLLYRHLMPLSELEPGRGGVIAQLKTSDPEMLQHMLDRGFPLQGRVEVIARDPFQGPTMALVNGIQRVVGYHVAECILIETSP